MCVHPLHSCLACLLFFLSFTDRSCQLPKEDGVGFPDADATALFFNHFVHRPAPSSHTNSSDARLFFWFCAWKLLHTTEEDPSGLWPQRRKKTSAAMRKKKKWKKKLNPKQISAECPPTTVAMYPANIQLLDTRPSSGDGVRLFAEVVTDSIAKPTDDIVCTGSTVSQIKNHGSIDLFAKLWTNGPLPKKRDLLPVTWCHTGRRHMNSDVKGKPPNTTTVTEWSGQRTRIVRHYGE